MLHNVLEKQASEKMLPLSSSDSTIVKTKMNVHGKESFIIPEIPSDESEVEDDKKPKIPGWATTPFLSQSLKTQTAIEADQIFGEVRPLRLEGCL